MLASPVPAEIDFHENLIKDCLKKWDLEEYIAAFESEL